MPDYNADNAFSLLAVGQIPSFVGARARRRRLALNLTQDEVARRSGTTLATIGRFEAGRNVGFEAIVRIAAALDAVEGFANLFPRPEMRTLDEVLAAGRERKRARR